MKPTYLLFSLVILEKMTDDHLGKELALKILNGEVKISDYSNNQLY